MNQGNIFVYMYIYNVYSLGGWKWKWKWKLGVSKCLLIEQKISATPLKFAVYKFQRCPAPLMGIWMCIDLEE